MISFLLFLIQISKLQNFSNYRHQFYPLQTNSQTLFCGFKRYVSSEDHRSQRKPWKPTEKNSATIMYVWSYVMLLIKIKLSLELCSSPTHVLDIVHCPYVVTTHKLFNKIVLRNDYIKTNNTYYHQPQKYCHTFQYPFHKHQE